MAVLHIWCCCLGDASVDSFVRSWRPTLMDSAIMAIDFSGTFETIVKIDGDFVNS